VSFGSFFFLLFSLAHRQATSSFFFPLFLRGETMVEDERSSQVGSYSFLFFFPSSLSSSSFVVFSLFFLFFFFFFSSPELASRAIYTIVVPPSPSLFFFPLPFRLLSTRQPLFLLSFPPIRQKFVDGGTPSPSSPFPRAKHVMEVFFLFPLCSRHRIAETEVDLLFSLYPSLPGISGAGLFFLSLFDTGVSRR